MSYYAVKTTSAGLSRGFVYYATDKIGYQPTLLARVRLTHGSRDAIKISLGVGSSDSPLWTKDFRHFARGCLAPQVFPSNNIVFDMTEGAEYVTNASTDLVFVSCLDFINGSGPGTIDYFSGQYVPWSLTGVSTDPPVNIPDNDSPVFARVGLRTIGLSDVSWATSPAQGRHIVRRPGCSQLHVVFQTSSGIFWTTSLDGGRNWMGPQFVATGSDPCISLDFQGTPWIAYRNDGRIYCAVKKATVGWKNCCVYWANNMTVGPPSMVCSNWWSDAVPWPPPPQWLPCDMGYAVFVAYPPALDQEIHRQLLFVPFDTIHQIANVYNYGREELHEQESPDQFDSMPSISRTPGDYLHVTWKIGDRSTGYDQVVYIWTNSATNPFVIRGLGHPLPVWTPRFQLSIDPTPGSEPVNDAYADGVMALWRAGGPAPYDIGVVDERYRAFGDLWRDVAPWSAGPEAGYPAMNRTAGVWRHEFDPLTAIGNVGFRFLGDNSSSRLTYSSADQTYPQADAQLAAAIGDYDTLRVIWTEPYNGQYAIKFASRLHDNTGRDGFYHVLCGQAAPSPYCLHRDGTLALDGYSIDYADSALVYRLRYLNPLYRYSIRAVA